MSLIEAQKAAYEVVNSNKLPFYNSTYIESKGCHLWIYDKAYKTCYSAYWLIATVANAVAQVIFCCLIPFMTINPINHEYRFLHISRRFEQLLAYWVLYPLMTGDLRLSLDLHNGKPIEETVKEVFTRLINHNKDLLNPEGETPFDYEVFTVQSDQINAFALPAGRMVVYTGILNQLKAAIEGQQIKESVVTFADGSTATVDLSGVTLDDALAAIIGHELTHVASRHSLADLSLEYLIATISNGVFGTGQGVNPWRGSYLETLFFLHRKKEAEYEADTTGAHFAKQAGFNPLGALYVQELFRRTLLGGAYNFYFEHLECLFTHPYPEHRKRALFAAITVLDRDKVKEARIQLAEDIYDQYWSSPAHRYARRQFV